MSYKKVWRKIFNDLEEGDQVLVIGPWIYKSMAGKIIHKIRYNDETRYLVRFRKKDFEKINPTDSFSELGFPRYCGGYFPFEDLKLL